MAKTRNSGDSTSAKLKKIFGDDHELLRAREYDGLKTAWEKANPGKPFTEGTRQIAANIKSRMRKEFGMRKRRKKHAEISAETEQPVKPLKPALLAPLEDHIDECLMLARGAGKEQLSEVIRSLKRARNLLIVMLGEK